MANFLSTPSSNVIESEKMFYYRVEKVFFREDHLIGYFESDIGKFHPDFVLVSPK